MSARKPYPSDLTAIQWQNIHHLFPGGDRPPRSPGRPRTYDRKDIVDAVLYLARTGCQWRSLPHDFPPWKTVSYYFYAWREAGVWEAPTTPSAGTSAGPSTGTRRPAPG